MSFILNRIVKPLAVWIARKSFVADLVLKAAIRFMQRTRFALARRQNPAEAHTVLFFSFMGRKFADSPRAIFEEMIADPAYADWRFIWAFRDAVSSEFEVTYGGNDRTEVVMYNTTGFFTALARAKYWVSNSHLPDGVKTPRSTVYLQTWHGTPLKKLGADIPIEDSNMPKKTRNYGSWYQLQASKWSFLTSQSPYFTEKISSAFRIGALKKPPVILDFGLPRNSNLFGDPSVLAASANELRQRLGLPAGKKIALYAPTFRDNQHSSAIGYTYNLGIDFDELRRSIGDEWVVLFRAHYFVASSLNFADYDGFVYDVSGFDDINDLFLVADVLVTDYSSSMIDFTNTGKPILLYAYDLDEYGNKLRGFYVDISEFPGPIYTEQSELADALNHVDRVGKEWAQTRADFRDRFATWDSAESTAKVVAAVFRD